MTVPEVELEGRLEAILSPSFLTSSFLLVLASSGTLNAAWRWGEAKRDYKTKKDWTERRRRQRPFPISLVQRRGCALGDFGRAEVAAKYAPIWTHSSFTP
jgi:hypothetical protein